MRSTLSNSEPVRPAPIYLDGFSTMPLAPEAREAMFNAWAHPGNAGSPHLAGERAAAAIANSRAKVARLINASPGEIIFTSGATEANNLAILGVARQHDLDRRRRIIVSSIEHKAVLEPAQLLEREGFRVDLAPVDGSGRLDLDAFTAMIGEDVLLVSIMAANNETGVLQPIKAAAALAHGHGALFHCDAAQAVGKIVIDVLELDVDLLSISAHKCYGPVGVGALFVAAGTPALAPQTFGGGQQRGLRPGTEPAPLIVGFGMAADVARQGLARDEAHGREMSARLERALSERQVRFANIAGDNETLPGSVVVQFDGIDANSLCAALAQYVSISTGSACTSGQLVHSHVLEAMGYSSASASEVVRIFCHRYITDKDVDFAADAIANAVVRLSFPLDEVASSV